MKTIYKVAGLVVGILFALCVNAQVISKAELYFDADPGIGKGTAIIVASPNDSVSITSTISTTGLSAGFHRLFVRTRNSKGVWSLVEGRTIFIDKPSLTSNAKIKKAEYFFDHDPGVGKAVATSSFTSADSVSVQLNTASVSSLSDGFHRLFVRVIDENGVWSLYEGRTLYINAPAVTNHLKIVKAEYFFDNDPGVGAGIALNTGTAADSVNINNNTAATTSLSPGFHRLFVRVHNESGVWSLTEGRPVFIDKPDNISASQYQIVKAESFFDTDPGVGKGIQLTPSFTPADSISLTRGISIVGLTSRDHHLYTRVQNKAGMWSLPIQANFTILYTDINQVPVNAGISVSPNPSNGNFRLDYNLSQSNAELKIIDITGRVIYKTRLPGASGRQNIDISNSGKGTYLWQIFENEALHSGKIIVTE